jgi:hypothetical protein
LKQQKLLLLSAAVAVAAAAVARLLVYLGVCSALTHNFHFVTKVGLVGGDCAMMTHHHHADDDDDTITPCHFHGLGPLLLGLTSLRDLNEP